MLAASDAGEVARAQYWYGRVSGHAIGMVRAADEAIRHMGTPPAGFTQAELNERMAGPVALAVCGSRPASVPLGVALSSGR